MEPVRTYEAVVHGQRVNVKVYPRGPEAPVTSGLALFLTPSSNSMSRLQVDLTWLDDEPGPRAPGRQRKAAVLSDCLA